MSEHNIYLQVPDYLAEWITHKYGNPVQMVKDSPEMRVLNEMLVKRPQSIELEQSPGYNLVIPIPHFKGKDPQYYNYMYDSGKSALIESFSSLFKKSLYCEISALQNVEIKRATVIYAFMEKNGISANHWDTVAQIYHRIKQKYFKEKDIKFC